MAENFLVELAMAFCAEPTDSATRALPPVIRLCATALILALSIAVAFAGNSQLMLKPLTALRAASVVSATAARAMAAGVRHRLGADLAISVTGVAGPDPQDYQPPGTVFVGIAIAGRPTTAVGLRLPGDRPRVRQYSAISALDGLRRALLDEA